MKTSTEIFNKMEKSKRTREELKRIREKRKRINAKEKRSSQKRSVEIVEYEDGTYSLIGYAWDLKLKEKEVSDAVKNWINGSLENGEEGELPLHK